MAIKYEAVLPSSLIDKRDNMDMNFKKRVKDNVSLKVGTVLEIIEPEDDTNQHGLGPEYNVMVVENQNISIYKNCLTIDSFGGIADYLRIKRRAPDDSSKVKDSGSLKKQKGSIVLLLCVDGSAEQAIVLGGLAHPDKGPLLSKELGHHLEGEFNGINWKINKDGELVLTFKSATESDGTPKDEEAGGTTVTMDKTGSIDINTNLEDDDETYIRMDKTNKDIGLKAGNQIGLTAKDAIGFNAGANLNLNAAADLIAEAEGNAALMSAGEVVIEAGSAMNVKAPTVNIQADSSIELKGNMINIKGQLVALGPSQGGPAVTANTQFLGTGNNGAPVISQAIGPFSSSVFIAD